MRATLLAVLLLIGGAAVALAQPGRDYAVYVFDPAEGADVYAFVARGRVAAVEVRGCGDYALLEQPETLVAQLRARAAADAIEVIRVGGRNSRTDLGWCGDVEDQAVFETEDPEAGPETDALVVIEDISARQMRRMLSSLQAPTLHAELTATLGL